MLLNLFTGKLPALLNEGFDWVDVRNVVAGIHSALIKRQARREISDIRPLGAVERVC